MSVCRPLTCLMWLQMSTRRHCKSQCGGGACLGRVIQRHFAKVQAYCGANCLAFTQNASLPCCLAPALVQLHNFKSHSKPWCASLLRLMHSMHGMCFQPVAPLTCTCWHRHASSSTAKWSRQLMWAASCTRSCRSRPSCCKLASS
jgi:hypothetical protein